MKIKKLFILCLLLTQWTIVLSQKVKTEDVFNRYLHTEDESLSKLIIKSNDGLYSLFCQGELAENIDESINLYTKFIQQNPKYGLEKAYLNRGIKYYQSEKSDAAITDFDNSIGLDKNEPYAFYFRGATYASLKKYDNAIEDYVKVIKLNPKFKLAYFMRGNSLFDQKKYQSAMKDYDKVIELDQNYDGAYLMRGIIYENMGEYKKAIAEWEEVLKINKNNAEDAKTLIEKAKKKIKEEK